MGEEFIKMGEEFVSVNLIIIDGDKLKREELELDVRETLYSVECIKSKLDEIDRIFVTSPNFCRYFASTEGLHASLLSFYGSMQIDVKCFESDAFPFIKEEQKGYDVCVTIYLKHHSED